MEVLLVAAAPNNFLGVWAQWYCGIVKFFLLKLQPRKEQGARSKLLNPSSTDDTAQLPLQMGKLRSASSPKEKKISSVKVTFFAMN